MFQSGLTPGRPISACRRCRKFKVGCDRAKPNCSRCAKAKVECLYGSASTNLPNGGPATGNETGIKHPAHPSPSGSFPAFQLHTLDHPTASPTSTAAEEHDPSLEGLSYYASARRQDHTSQPAPDQDGSFRHPGRLTRDRAILSCMRCRRHKVRCDRQIPCGRCVRNRREAQCIYSEPVPAQGRIISDKHHETLDRIATSFIDSKLDATIRNGTHWNSILFEMRDYLPPGHKHDPHLDVHHEKPISGMTSTINYPFSGDTPGPDAIARIIAQLPPRAVQELFVSKYVDSVEQTYHLLDLDAFDRELHEFWADTSSKDDDWLSQYLLILNLGCQAVNYCNEESGKEAYPSLPPRFLRSAEICLKRTPYLLMPSLDTIRSLCLIVLSKQMYAMSCHEADACWPLTGLIVRLSIRMGLHRTAAMPYELLSHDERIKARVWAVVLNFEMRQSLVCGMPLLLRPVDISCPTAKHDASTKSPSLAKNGDAEPMSPNEFSLLVKVFASSSDLLFRAIELATCPNDSVRYSEVAEVDSSMRQQLLQSGVGLANGHLGMSKAEEIDLEECMIQIFFRQILMALHARFALQANASTEYPISYVSSLESALAILAYQRDVCEDDKWAELCAWFAGIFRHEFFTAAMTVCSQLVRDMQLTSLTTHAGFCETQPHELILNALQSCRDLWYKEKTWSVSNANAFALVDNLVRILRQAQEKESPSA